MNENVLNDVSINSFSAGLEVTDNVTEGEVIVRNGHSPYIGSNGNWYEWNDQTQAYVDTEVKAEGPQGPAGKDGKDGADGKDGKDGINGTDGSDGQDGVSPAITITAITGGHAITITDALHPNGQTFNVMDGADGQDGSDGQDGADGSDYVLTAQDKADIAALVVQLIPEAEGSGF